MAAPLKSIGAFTFAFLIVLFCKSVILNVTISPLLMVTGRFDIVEVSFDIDIVICYEYLLLPYYFQQQLRYCYIKKLSTLSKHCTRSCIFNCDYANELTCNIMLKNRFTAHKKTDNYMCNYRFLFFIALLHTFIYDTLTYSYIKIYALYLYIRFIC